MLSRLYSFLFVRLLDYSRNIRSRYLGALARPLEKIGVSANQLTVLSFIFGIISVYFLFQHHTLFVLFGCAHLLLDVMDGVLARLSVTTQSGAYFDTITDSIIALLLLGTYSVYIDSFGWVAVVLYLIHHFVFLASGMKTPMIFTRTIILILYFFKFYSGGVIAVLVASVFGLGLQAYHFTRLRPK